jgi:hypothetical protein
VEVKLPGEGDAATFEPWPTACQSRSLPTEGVRPMAIDEAWAMLATRIPKALHKELRLHCVTSGTPHDSAAPRRRDRHQRTA